MFLPSVQCDAQCDPARRPGRTALLGSPAFLVYLSARGEGRRKIAGDAAARAGRYSAGGERD